MEKEIQLNELTNKIMWMNNLQPGCLCDNEYVRPITSNCVK